MDFNTMVKECENSINCDMCSFKGNKECIYIEYQKKEIDKLIEIENIFQNK